MGYRCHLCEANHEGLPDLGFEKPDSWFGIPEGERAARVELTGDTCAIDGEEFFLRGVLFVPVTDSDDAFGLGVWVSQSRESFDKYIECRKTEVLPPSFGWLATRIPFYEPSTFGLEADVRFTRGPERPSIILHASDHPLSTDQRKGISLARAWEMVHRALEPHGRK